MKQWVWQVEQLRPRVEGYRDVEGVWHACTREQAAYFINQHELEWVEYVPAPTLCVTMTVPGEYTVQLPAAYTYRAPRCVVDT